VLEGPYRGAYGRYFWTRDDQKEVVLYRGALSLVALSFSSAALLASFGHRGAASAALLPLSASLGASTVLIHIYVTPIKRAIQLLCTSGAAASAVLAAPAPLALLDTLQTHRWQMLFVGPLFASLEGIAIKEGLCYGTPEATAISVLNPTACILFLAGASDSVCATLFLTLALSLDVFAAKKWAQDPHDDFGDKSVFEVQKMSLSEQEEWLRRVEAARSPEEMPIIG
jgi:uncharacterized integral membrane protein